MREWFSASLPAASTSVQDASPLQHTAAVTRVASADALARAVHDTPYSIGYVGLDWAIAYHLPSAALQNASGAFQDPTKAGLLAALQARVAVLGLPRDFRASLIGLVGRYVYPLTFFDFALLHRRLSDVPGVDLQTRRCMKAFLIWAITYDGGQAALARSGLVPLIPGPPKPCVGFCPVPNAIPPAVEALVESIDV
jgi:ABC-type phosphate transport system substrate-binding protein